MGAVIGQNNKPIALFSIILSKPQCKYTTAGRKVISKVEYLKQFRGIIFSYKINIFSDNKNLVYAATPSEYQRVMRWQLILKRFGPNIQHIGGVYNIVADILSSLPSTPVDKYKTSISKSQCCITELFEIGREENNKD